MCVCVFCVWVRGTAGAAPECPSPVVERLRQLLEAVVQGGRMLGAGLPRGGHGGGGRLLGHPIAPLPLPRSGGGGGGADRLSR